MDVDRRMRTGALLGALAGPPLVFLLVYPLFEPHVIAEVQAVRVPILAMCLMTLSWVVGMAGLPVLGASVLPGAWVGRALGWRLSRWCIGGAMAGGLLASILRRTVPALAGGKQGGVVLRLVCVEVSLVAAVLLCFRRGKARVPA